MTETTSTSTAGLPAHDEDGHTRAAAFRNRLDRLDGYLRSDPRNNALLIDAFETALACREWERAEFHLRHGQSLQVETLAWKLREGDFWLAQQRYDEALSVLDSLASTANPPDGFADVVLHNLAFIEMRRGQHGACVLRLAQRLDAMAGQPAADAEHALTSVTTRALQQLWLRALHHDGQLERATTWTHEAERNGQLDPQAAGIASLVAIDAADFTAAQRWSAMSLTHGEPADHPVEVLVAQASLALAARDAVHARQFAEAALRRNPGDGRAGSAMGFAALLAGELAPAAEAFEHALSIMPQHIGTWHGLGWTRILQGKLREARRSFETALELDRNFAESHGGLAVVLAMLSQREAALDHVELALRLDRSNVSGRYAQALLSGEAKDARDIQRLARRLLGGHAAPFGGDIGQMFGKDEEKGSGSSSAHGGMP